MERGPMPRLLLLFLLAEVQIFRLSMPIGFSIVCKEGGYSAWMNPFNGKKSFVSYLHTRFIVFWSKYPAPLLPFLTILKEKQINCYIQCKHSKKCTFYTLRFGCSFAAVNTIKPQLL